MVTEVSDRNTVIWQIAKTANPQTKWKYICVFSYVREPKQVTDIVAVDFSILEDQDTLPELRKLLIKELELIWKDPCKW